MPAAKRTSSTGKSLRQELEDLILGHLVELQEQDLHQKSWQILLETLDPRSNQIFEQTSRAASRVSRYHTAIQGAQAEGRVLPWIYLPGAAATVEGIWTAAALLWLNTPLPNDLDQLARPVTDLVSLEVGAFVAAIGGVPGVGWMWPGAARA